MRASLNNLLVLALLLLCLLFVALNTVMHGALNPQATVPDIFTSPGSQVKLLELQTTTISELSAELERLRQDVSKQATSPDAAAVAPNSASTSEVDNLKALYSQASSKIAVLTDELTAARSASPAALPPPAPPVVQGSSAATVSSGQYKPFTNLQADCDRRFGQGLIDAWMANPVTICEGGASKMTCYSHKHDHQGKAQWYCVAENMSMDFSKIQGGAESKKPPRGASQYHSFSSGAFFGDCTKTNDFSKVEFMPHMQLMMKAFTDNTKTAAHEAITTPTYVSKMLQRGARMHTDMHAHTCVHTHT